MSGSRHVHQVNLQRGSGGGERYTRFFTRALLEAGCRVSLYVRARSLAWRGLGHPMLSIVPLKDEVELLTRLPALRALVLTQGPLAEATLETIARRHFLAGFAHMPISAGRSARPFRSYALVIPVSSYVLNTLRAGGVTRVYGEPVYGIADLGRPEASRQAGPIVAASPYDWDPRKFRDRVLALLHPSVRAFAPRALFRRRAGLTLGIVSRLTPIKQFPLLFQYLGPVIAGFNGVNLEIFGHGGYASVRDLRRALAPISDRVRFWGFQERVGEVYPLIDYLMSGLPEKEALGLNLIEAQACGTPVLAVNAPPFTETVLDGRTGYLYRDPRSDGGADFARTLERIVDPNHRLDPRGAVDHLQRFSFPALLDRTSRLLAFLAPQVGWTVGA